MQGDIKQCVIYGITANVGDCGRYKAGEYTRRSVLSVRD